MQKASNDGFSVLGIGVAACLACCAGPILFVLGGLGIAGIASTLLVGAVGLLITALAVAGFLRFRRRRPATCEAGGNGRVEVSPAPHPRR